MATDFGRDISCSASLRTGRYATGLQLVAENAYHRLTTPRGMLQGGDGESSYGTDLSALVGAQGTAGLAVRLPGIIDLELTKDERILATSTVVLVLTDGPSTRFLLTVSVQTDAGPFTLQLAVSDVTTELLGITTEAP